MHSLVVFNRLGSLAGRGNYHPEQRYKADHVYVEKKAMTKMRGTKKVMGMRKAKKGTGKGGEGRLEGSEG